MARRKCRWLVLLLWITLVSSCYGSSLLEVPSALSEWPPFRTVIGAQKLIVVTVEFPDVRNGVTRAYIQDLIFHQVDSYYREASYGQCWITGNVTSKWYQMSKVSSAYEWDGKSDVQPYMSSMIQEAVNLADDEVDYSQYRYIVVLHPARWRTGNWGFMASQTISTHEGPRTVNVAIISEYESMSVFAHEFGHIFGGLPDMYGKIGGQYLPVFVGPWDLMSQTGGYTQHFSAWSKTKMGWIQPSAVVTAPRGRTVNATIGPLELPSSRAYALKIPLTQGTYYLAEVRQNIGSDMGLPDNGLVVYFVDESKNEWGESPLVVQDSNPNTTTLNDATFDLCDGKQAGFLDKKNGVSIVIASKQGLSYAVTAGPVSQGEMILAQTPDNDSCYYSQTFNDPIGDLFDEYGFPAKAEPYLDIVSTDIRKSGDSYLIELSVNGAMPEKIDSSIWIEWDIAVDADSNADTGWTWGYNDIGVDYIIRVGILDSTYYPQVMKTQPTFHEIAKPPCQIKGSKILFTLTAAEFQMPSSLVWMVTAQKYGQRGEPPNPPFLGGDKAPNSRHYTTPIESIRSVTETTTTTHVSTVSETTTATGTMPPSPGPGAVPGFPVESILAGLVSGATVLFVLRGRRRR